MTFFIWSFIKPATEILILWFLFYRTLVFFEGTRSFHVLKGLIYLVIAFLLSQILGFDTLNWLLTKFFGISIIALLIIFQQELRLGLARLGQQHLFNVPLEDAEVVVILEEITDAVFKMAKNNIGCLIAIERDDKLKTYIESGVAIDAKISSELIQSIFMTYSPLHDGGVVTRSDRVIAAACLFPLSENTNISKIVGTRHRAALGLTEQTDAVVILVSEETGEISVATEGRFIPIVNRERALNILKSLLIIPSRSKK